MAITSTTSRYVRTRTLSPNPPTAPPPKGSSPSQGECPTRRIASNFVFLSAAEIICRGISVAVALSLTRTLAMAGYGRIEFAFNVVFWLVLIVRDSIEVIAARELARHPRLLRPLVNHVLAAKILFALVLFAGLNGAGFLLLKDAADRWILFLYGLMLLNTAMGIDFVYKGTERMGLVAVSLCIRTMIFACGVWLWVTPARAALVPICLAVGEGTGIALVWFWEYLFLVCVLWAAGWTLLRRWRVGESASAVTDNGPHAWLTTIWRPLLPALATAAIFLFDSDTMLRVDNTFIPSPTRLIHYLLFFVVGAWVSQLKDPKERLIPRSFLYLILSSVTFAALTPLLLRHAAAPLSGTERLVFCTLAALFPWLTIFGALGVLLRFVQDRGPVMRFLAEASFWVYIIHVPLVALFQVLLLPFAWPPALKFLLVSAAALLLSLFTYEYLVRRSLIGGIVNGTKKKSKHRRWPGPEFAWVATAVVIMGSSLWGVWTLRSFFFGENFHVVVQGKVYRSSRLKPADLDRQIQRLGIRSVIAINTDDSQHFWVKEQRYLCEKRNLTFTCLTIPAVEAPSAQRVVELVRLLDNCPRPILIEGQRGVRNVSFASAVARLLDGSPPRDALGEFSSRYGEFTALDHSALAESVLGYRQWLTAQNKLHSASEFREWARDRCRLELPVSSTVANDSAALGVVR